MNPYPRDEQGNPLPSKGEKICVAHLEERFPGRKFPKHKTLRWLTNPETGRHLELDCYNEELRLAVEYNGRQHYEFVPDMHESEEGLKYQQRLDALKKELCEKNNVHLIVVNYKVPRDQIPAYIDKELRALGLLTEADLQMT